MTGTTISHYDVLEKLGEGGMGQVYKGRDRRLGRTVALKFLPLGATVELQERFQQEAQIISALNHPHIATLFDFGEAAGKRFLVMEYLPGGTLAARIREAQALNEHLPLFRVLKYSTQVAEALTFAHRHGVVHRDLKPENILLAEDGSLKVTDFGLARMEGAARLSSPAVRLGTPAYMSPEQAQAGVVDQRSDIFAFGLIVYEIATNRRPFDSPYELGLLYEIINTPAPPIRKLRPGLTEAFERVVAGCLEKIPSERYQRMEEVIDALKAMQGPTDQLTPPSATGALTDASMGTKPPSRARSEVSIVVLPFLDLSREKDKEYICDGIVDQLISWLGQIENLRVICRTSSFVFKGRQYTMNEVRESLGVTRVIEGSVHSSGDRLRISVRHVDAVQERETWSGRFQGSTSELFDIQDRVASALIQGLQRDLGQTLRQPLVAEGTASMEAYNLYLKGKFHAGRRNPQDMKLGLKYLEEAVAEDPNFADAHAEIADLCSVMGWYELMEPKLGWQRGEVAAQRALTINSQLPDAHVALGTVRSFFYWDWEGARREFECALELNRNHARAHFRLGVNYLVPTGQLREAVVSIKEALRFDPLSALYHTILGTFYDCMDLNELAIRSHEQALEIDPHQAMALWGLGRVYARLKDYDRAQKTFEKCVEIAPTFRYLGALAQCHAFSGNEAKAREMLGTMLRKPGVERAQFPLGSVYLALGQKEEAIQCFRYELERRNPAAIWIGVEPFFRPLRGDPRFLDCCQEIGLTIA